jgi:hypothetical protein
MRDYFMFQRMMDALPLARKIVGRLKEGFRLCEALQEKLRKPL